VYCLFGIAEMLTLESEHCYQAMLAHDIRFDGVFLLVFPLRKSIAATFAP
jgi:hypothetical protein